MADAWGIEPSFTNATGETEWVSEETIDGLRRVLGEAPSRSGPIVLGEGEATHLGSGDVLFENGTSTDARNAGREGLPSGYHWLTRQGEEPRRIIVSPGRCHLPDDLRTWGWASQLYGMRSRRSWGMGDLSDLRRLARWSAESGAGFALISPIAAVAPTDEQRANPYYPASRRFRNPLYLSVGDVPGAEHVAGELGRAGRAGHSLNDTDVVDRDAVWRIKRSALETIWESTSPPEDFDRWLDDQTDSLPLFAVWSVLTERHGPVWQEWPPRLHDPRGEPVVEVSHREHDRVRFHAWLQWCLITQLDDAGRELAIIQDLPIGFDPGGFDAWEWQDLLAMEASVGAPPDAFNQAGQDWGAPPFVPWRLASAGYEPFIQSVRANLATGGGLRIDHVMGLWRLWCIPPGAGPAEGAYVRFPAEDLLAILALESRRAGALIVGEDLGTVESGVRETLSEHDMLSYRLLWFEPGPPPEWPVKAMAAVTTHDLPTVAGLWDGSDVEEQRRLGLEVDEEGFGRIRSRLSTTSGISGGAPAEEAIIAAYRQLSRAPSRLLSATLEDALSVRTRPNMPGASGRHLNWRQALPVPLEEIESHPLANRLADLLDGVNREGAETGGNGKEPNG